MSATLPAASFATFAEQPLSVLKGVGPRVADKLRRLGLHTLGDLLFHLPLRYQDRTRVTPIGTLQVGLETVIEGDAISTEIAGGRRSMLLCRVEDGSGYLTLRFFHFSAGQRQQLASGVRVRCFGEVRAGIGGFEMIHPEYRIVASSVAEATATEANDDCLTAIYPTTEGLHQGMLRKLMAQVLNLLEDRRNDDTLPDAVRRSLAFPELPAALRLVHEAPPVVAEQLAAFSHPAQRRLAFEELLAQQLSLRRLRAEVRDSLAAHPIGAGDELQARFAATLAFELTAAQQRVVTEIAQDMGQTRPMLRLLQGDVGCGKTVVAALSALSAIESGQQVAVMAPTELLAEQHYRSFSDWFTPLGLEVVWLAGRQTAKMRAAALQQLASGSAQLVVGTHALLQETVVFRDLALAIIDEQHRFGVHQRLALREKGRNGELCPHQLIMTATPIPRTLAMTAYADLDVSIIDQLPPGRSPVVTAVVPEARRVEVIKRIAKVCGDGRQSYWVCTLIEHSDSAEAEAAEATAARLTEALPGLRVGLVHGRMKSDEKERVMAAFKSGEADVLVATTVIEVGVDVANASLMIIENAERLGLAQLHQLRGRVGRGSVDSHCLLLYRPPLSQVARSRLAVMRETNDGFAIAERDLMLRGPGEVLGTRQTGDLDFRIADLVRDQDLLPKVSATADRLLQRYPQYVEALIGNWLGAAAEYGGV